MTPIQKAADTMAKALGEAVNRSPPGLDYAVFVIADLGASFESVLASSLPPAVFAPILRTWLERYDAGEAAEFKPDA